MKVNGIKVARPIAKVIEDEAARNPAFGRRFRAAVAEAAENHARRRRSPPVLDPVDIAREFGKDGLRLADLDIEQLKDIVSHHAMDSCAMRWKTRERVLETVVEVAHSRAHKGDVFRYWTPPERA